MKTALWIVLYILAFGAGIAWLFYADQTPGKCMDVSYLPCQVENK